MYSSKKEQNLFLMQIQRKREAMCLLGKIHGLNAVETIKCSQELDSLLNEYYRLFQATNSKSTKFPRKTVTNIYVNQLNLLKAK